MDRPRRAAAPPCRAPPRGNRRGSPSCRSAPRPKSRPSRRVSRNGSLDQDLPVDRDHVGVPGQDIARRRRPARSSPRHWSWSRSDRGCAHARRRGGRDSPRSSAISGRFELRLVVSKPTRASRISIERWISVMTRYAPTHDEGIRNVRMDSQWRPLWPPSPGSAPRRRKSAAQGNAQRAQDRALGRALGDGPALPQSHAQQLAAQAHFRPADRPGREPAGAAEPCGVLAHRRRHDLGIQAARRA